MVIHVVLVVVSFLSVFLSSIIYMSRKKRAIPNIFRYGVVLLSLFSIILFIIASILEFPFLEGYILNKFIIDYLSLAMAVFSLRLIYFSFGYKVEDVIDLDYPSRLRFLRSKIKFWSQYLFH